MNILLIDFANMSMRSLFSSNIDILDDEFTIYKSRLLLMLKNILSTFEYDSVVFCLEGGQSWRKQLYPAYKATRVTDRNVSPIDFDKFFEQQDSFINDFANIAKNFLFLRVEHAEADDLIATIVRQHENDNVTCISTDRDFYQLYKYKNYRQYNSITKKYVEVLNPESYLTEKIILGDVSDNIPRISGLTKGKGPKYVEKFILPDVEKWLNENQMVDEWDRNYKLIAFDAIPEEYSSAIIKLVNEFKPGQFDARNMLNLLMKHKLGGLVDELTEYINIFGKTCYAIDN